MKEFLIKNIDILTEKLRFIHNLMVALLSGLAGILFAIISKSLILDLGIIITLAIGVLLLVIFIISKNSILEEQMMMLEKLKDLK